MAHDSNAFVRWEAAQLLAQRTILANVQRRTRGEEMQIAPALVDAFAALFADRSTDPALVAAANALGIAIGFSIFIAAEKILMSNDVLKNN